MKKIILALLLTLGSTAVTPVATADPDIPLCFPCDNR